MYASLRRYLVSHGINIYFAKDFTVTKVEGCDHKSFDKMRAFCAEVADEELLDALLESMADDGDIIGCDCQYLVNQLGDFIITGPDEYPVCPN